MTFQSIIKQIDTTDAIISACPTCQGKAKMLESPIYFGAEIACWIVCNSGCGFHIYMQKIPLPATCTAKTLLQNQAIKTWNEKCKSNP